MISSDVIRGYIDIMILYILLRCDSYGYEISKYIREFSKEQYIIKETTLYSAFNRMEKIGYIESYAGNVTHGKPRTYYCITGTGRQYYNEKCQEWELTKSVINSFTEDS